MDRWLPRPSTFRVLSRPTLGRNLLVSQLKLESGKWNVPLIEQHFLPEDVTSIFSLPTSSSCSHNSLLWHYDKWGVFYVKSGYQVALSSSNLPSGSGSGSMES
ncbi:hypothetical protein ACOSQ2_005370 [Xanthoceras sorbifolium]